MSLSGVFARSLRIRSLVVSGGVAAALGVAAASGQEPGLAQASPAPGATTAVEGRTRAAGLSVENGWARATPPGAMVGGGFLTIRNDGEDDRLIAASSPVAGRVELHTMTMQDNVMRMRQLDSIALPDGERVELRPGGDHLMFMDLAAPLEAGSTIPVTLRFEKAGEVQVQLQVLSIGAAGPGDRAGNHDSNPRGSH